MASLNEPQKRVLLCGFLDIHRRMAELEALLVPEPAPTPFSQYANDLSPTEAKVVGDYFARIRTAMLAHLRECGIPLDVRPASRRWALRCGISFIGITVDELRPEKLRGYGDLHEEGRARIHTIHDDLERLVDRVGAYLRDGQGRDLARRLERLDAAPASRATLELLERITSRWRLVEFRPTIETIVGRLESPAFEIAVFGRVSSGKSSLLNHIAGADALPVGVTPITAVPTRLAHGATPSAVISFAEVGPRTVPVEQLGEFASEAGNPGNAKHVTDIVVRLPSPRLRDGVIFVDTPGLGSLAIAGAAESLAYLPRCDLGIVLVDAAATLSQDDLGLLRALYEAGIPAMVLLSKADLLTPADRDRMIAYIREQFRRELDVELPVHPVSIVGADEALLDRWFAEELAPRLDRHRALAEQSLRRKIAQLRESVRSVLETLRARAPGGRTGGADAPDVAAARRLLEESDQVIRRARGLAQAWSDSRREFVEGVPRAVAEGLAADADTARNGAVGRSIEAELARRGRAAHELVARLREILARTLEALARAAPLANADPAAIRDLHSGGLPVPDLDGLTTATPRVRPWWSGIAPGLALLAIERRLRGRLGARLDETVAFYDRQLESWVKANVARVVERFEAQADAFREQVRRLTAQVGEPVADGDTAELEADLRALDAIVDAGPEPVAASGSVADSRANR